MRILTITVSILSIGIVAALPFRRTPVPEPPTGSLVANPEPLVARDLVVDPWPWNPGGEETDFSQPPDVPERDDPGAAILGPDRPPRAGSRRNARVSEASAAGRVGRVGRSSSRDGYEAWMIPIDESPLLRERFAATMDPESDGASARPTADGPTAETPSGGTVAWKTVSLDRSAPGPGHDDEPWVAPPSDPSYSFTPARDDAPSRPASERHWIRQPADR